MFWKIRFAGLIEFDDMGDFDGWSAFAYAEDAIDGLAEDAIFLEVAMVLGEFDESTSGI